MSPDSLTLGLLPTINREVIRTSPNC